MSETVTKIVIFRSSSGVYDFEDDPKHFYLGSEIFDEKLVEVTANDLNWLQKHREIYGWDAWDVQGVLEELFDRG